MVRLITPAQAAGLLQSHDTLLIGGSGGGHAVPDRLMQAVGDRYRESGQPKNLTALHPVGLGDGQTTGAGYFAQPGLLARVISGTYVNSPAISDLVLAGEIEGWTLPQGVLSQLMREMAAGRPGLLTRTGLHTFVDPEHQGGRQSPAKTEELVERVRFQDDDYLFYKPYHVDVCFLRGTTADEDGNITMEQEAVFGEMLSEAQATRRCGGIVVVQVRRLAQRGTLPAKQVKIPGIFVDYVVVVPDQLQTYLTPYSPAYAGELRIPLSDIARLPLDARKVIARRAAMELMQNAVCNLGAGISTGIPNVAAEEGVLDAVCLTNEQGLIGGAPAPGGDAGAATNYDAMVDQPYQFDFYDGGGVDLAFLSFAEVDRQGNVNVSRFGKRIIGPGGFINISQNARKVVYSGTFTTGGSRLRVADGRLVIEQEGAHRKFVQDVQQITYNGPYGQQRGQTVLYVTERAVFELGPDGLILTEIAPGVNLEQDVLAHMGFRPIVSDTLKTMDPALFDEGPIGLAGQMAQRGPMPPRSTRIAAGEGIPQ